MSVHFRSQSTLRQLEIILIPGLLNTDKLCDNALILGTSRMAICSLFPDNQKCLVCQLARIGGGKGGSWGTV